MAAARYTIHVPTTDELNQPLRLHEAVHQHLINNRAAPVQTHHGTPSHTVSGWAEDTPEWDSLAKQTGTLAAELANVPAVHVTKEGDKPASWAMANNGYVPGAGADQSALSYTSPVTGVHASMIRRGGW